MKDSQYLEIIRRDIGQVICRTPVSQGNMVSYASPSRDGGPIAKAVNDWLDELLKQREQDAAKAE